jgi:murein DD-endopeptidase MepM/ murein hydrolase activator NlpD
MRIIPVIAALFMLSSCVADNAPPPQVYYYGTQGGAVNTAGIHTVEAHDTPWTIAQDYHLPVQDLLAVNHLRPPYKLHDGQRLILPPPATYVTKPGDNIYRISRTFNVSMTQLAQLNDLREPFAILPGKKLRLPSVMRSPSPLVRTASVTRYTASAPARSNFFGWEKAPPSRHAGGRFIWPVSGPVISAYGPKANGLHNDGINIRAPRGAPVRAADDGVVVYAGNELKGFGNLVLLRHNDRWMTAYAHMERLDVRRGQTVRQGDMIGAVGSTGSANSPQLHFEVRHGTEALNPAIYLRS